MKPFVMLVSIGLLAWLGLAHHISPLAPQPLLARGAVVSSTRQDVNGDHQDEFIEILLVEGERYVDETPWCGLGDKWEGQFEVQVRSGATILSRQSVNDLMEIETLFFRAPHFELVLQDYNQDGQIDFNLGRYSGCNGCTYYLFTAAPDGRISRLGNNTHYIFDHRNSTPDIQIVDGLVGFPFYSQSSRLVETEWCEWNGETFDFVTTTYSDTMP